MREDVDSRRARCVISWLNEVLIEVTGLSREGGSLLNYEIIFGLVVVIVIYFSIASCSHKCMFFADSSFNFISKILDNFEAASHKQP